MKISRAEFITSAANRGGWPAPERPEVAFSGRSNVGKSSLINSLTGRKKLVKTSTTPGKTQLINFFGINDRYIFTDLPGYGYAEVPLAVKRKWRPMIEEYLRERETLRGVVLLVDARRGAKEMDLMLLEWLAAVNLPACIAVTKIDKLKQNERRAAVDDLVRTLEKSGGLYGQWSGPIQTSAVKGWGKNDLMNQIEEWLEDSPRDAPAA
ncbi:MAG: ribosome biogenesis GTP-binding protein YihA/YsxC [bacterium]|nr:ribosome biogenesis GTP-binding protein YihA/YsxC [bacterium]